MEKRKLTKEDLDKVRRIEGFPIGKDEDIIALSDPPYYTACPNPFIEDFIKEHGKPYDEATDDYHREPFASDVSEGKHDPMYMAHSYHTKVPFRAIMQYILYYTRPGDIVFDGFSGSGMVGVAAQMCGKHDIALKQDMHSHIPQCEWGTRKAIISDLSTIASFIGYNFNVSFDTKRFVEKGSSIIKKLHSTCDWMYETVHEQSLANGNIEYTVWSDVYLCPNCGEEICYWDIAVSNENKMIDKPKCPKCHAYIEKNKCKRSTEPVYDEKLSKTVYEIKSIPVKIFYTHNKKRYAKKPTDADLELIRKIKSENIPFWYPTDELPKGYNTEQPMRSHGIYCVHQFYTKRNLYVLSKCYNFILEEKDERMRKALMFWFTSIYSRSHKCNRYMPNHNRHVGPLSGTLYIPFFQAEINIISLLEDKLKSIQNVKDIGEENVMISTQSLTDSSNVPASSVDYIFTDPPFGDNLNYSELNFLWESWIKEKTNNTKEAVINPIQHKGLNDYHRLMSKCFDHYYRILKPNRWLTVEFHNSKNVVWNVLQEAIQTAGFVIADVRVLDKQKGTTKQLSNTSIVKQDLVISAYKPKESLVRDFTQNAGTPETAWAFVRQHLFNLPRVVKHNNQIETVAERQAFLLFDRMVAYHIMQGLPVPIDAAEFYKGLDERFLKRDNMYFLPDQVNEYDLARSTCELEKADIALFVTDEKSAIGWLYGQLDEKNGGKRQTYQVLQPKFMQEVKAVKKTEKMPELIVMLEENFLKDENGAWYVPDLTKSGDVAKLREKNLLKEFQEYQATKGKLKVFRSEAIRAGFAKLWKDKDYKAIVALAERLPEETVQEDPNILMYYDISLSRV